MKIAFYTATGVLLAFGAWLTLANVPSAQAQGHRRNYYPPNDVGKLPPPHKRKSSNEFPLQSPSLLPHELIIGASCVSGNPCRT